MTKSWTVACSPRGGGAETGLSARTCFLVPRRRNSNRRMSRASPLALPAGAKVQYWTGDPWKMMPELAKTLKEEIAGSGILPGKILVAAPSLGTRPAACRGATAAARSARPRQRAAQFVPGTRGKPLLFSCWSHERRWTIASGLISAKKDTYHLKPRRRVGCCNPFVHAQGVTSNKQTPLNLLEYVLSTYGIPVYVPYYI